MEIERLYSDDANSMKWIVLLQLASILGCADSRVPAEIVFDQGLGDLFVVRVAGNVASQTAIGSLEFASAVLGSQLIVVVGHSRCGAVAAAVEGDPLLAGLGYLLKKSNQP